MNALLEQLTLTIDCSLDLFNTSAVFKFLHVDQMRACAIVKVINFFITKYTSTA